MKKITLSILLLSLCCVFAEDNFTVHEWGTFTSVQGGDGKLIPWRPLKTAELPSFVYDWTKPGLGRFSPTMMGGKGVMVTLQRMETPVIYFYSPSALKVDVSVKFPKGIITEWYPQATQIGPASSTSSLSADDTVTTESLATWKNLVVSPANLIQQPPELISDKSGNHYYAARKTDSLLVQNAAGETDKFLFYRGAGSFETPLKATVDTNGLVSVENKGAGELSHLFLVTIHHGTGAFAEIDTLSPSNVVSWCNLNTASWHNFSRTPADWGLFTLPEFQEKIAGEMESALTDEGLFPREAHAMVQTWMDSWFTEEGERVLYILPRTWTDETLPLTITPQPKNLVRVMVDRAEIITPRTQQALTDSLTQAAKGDMTARSNAIVQLRELGRFAEPAINLAHVQSSAEELGYYGNQLLPEVLKPAQK